MSQDSTFIILAASPSRNLQEYGCLPLMRYQRSFLVSHQIKVIKLYKPEAKIKLVCGFEFERILNENLPSTYHCETIYNENYFTNNQSDSLKLALNDVENSNVWILNGDLNFSKSCLKTPNPELPYVFADAKNRFNQTKLGIHTRDKKLISIDYGLDLKWTQIVYIPKQYLTILKECCGKNLFTYDVINQFNQVVDIFVHTNKHASIREIDSKKDLV